MTIHPTSNFIEQLAQRIRETESVELSARSLNVDPELLESWRHVGLYEDTGPFKALADAVDEAMESVALKRSVVQPDHIVV
jgi:hypothetical protein